MRYVAQEGDHDCGPAVLAMLTGRTLAETKEWIGYTDETRGMQPGQMHWWLWKDGFYLRSVKLATDLPSGAWPPAAFADRHYLMVTATKGGHFTALDGDGTLLDPWDRTRETLDVYQAVHEIVGLYRP